MNIHIVYLEKLPLQVAMGDEIGKQLEKEHKANGVVLHPENTITKIHSENGKAKSVELKDGSKIDADLIILGCGAVPTTEFLKSDSSLKLDK